ncbi:hypothetical protein OW972_25765, partial [Klebsiella pneumoniae]
MPGVNKKSSGIISKLSIIFLYPLKNISGDTYFNFAEIKSAKNGLTSVPIEFIPINLHVMAVVPLPKNGSKHVLTSYGNEVRVSTTNFGEKGNDSNLLIVFY